MKRANKRMLLAAGLIAGAAALTGCSAQITPAATPTPDTAQTTTMQPATAKPDTAQMTPEPSASAAAEETTGPISLRVNGEELTVHALQEEDMLLLPLIQTAKALGWSAQEEASEEETQTSRHVVLSKEDSRISVSWVVSDNTARKITWQKDGLLIPVDTKITTMDDKVYVPAAFFEEAMEAQILHAKDGVSVNTPQPKDTPDTSMPDE